MGLFAKNGVKSKEMATPATPAATIRLLYPKTDGWYGKDSAGVEKILGSTVPEQYLLFHHGSTGIYTLTPLTAGTVEPANVPMGRTIADLSKATQLRIVIGQRAIGSGGTSCEARIQYSTNGATQSAWADANNTGTGISLQAGTANTVRDGGWVDLKVAARVDSTYLRFAIVTVGTVTTAPTLSFAEVQFR